MVVDCSATVCYVYFGRAGCDRDAERGIVIDEFDGHLEFRPDGSFRQLSPRRTYDVPDMRKTLKSNSVREAGKNRFTTCKRLSVLRQKQQRKRKQE
jgi:hypothetical protein